MPKPEKEPPKAATLKKKDPEGLNASGSFEWFACLCGWLCLLHKETGQATQGIAACAIEGPLGDIQPRHDLAIGNALHIGIIQHRVVVPDARQGFRGPFFLRP